MRRAPLALPIGLAPAAARAHPGDEGISGVILGLTHALQTAPLGLAVAGLGLAVGLARPRGFGAIWAAFAIAFAVGAGLGVTGRAAPLTAEAALYATALLAGLAAALAGPAPRRAALPLHLLGGLAAGSLMTPPPAPPAATAALLAGTFVASGAGLLCLAAASGWLAERRVPALTLALRIVGAWIAAIALLMLALAFAPR